MRSTLVPLVLSLLLALLLSCCAALPATPAGRARHSAYADPPEATSWWRPLVHFTPDSNWINDPNGLIWDPVHSVYHLFQQYNPYGNEWGSMSWGHATSPDLITWTHYPVAILIGDGIAIFSGSAVLDTNTTGLCPASVPLPCLICVYAGDGNGLETVNLAASSDASFLSFTKYAHNPVLNINSSNFRDPSVMFYTNDGRALPYPPPGHSRTAPAGHWVVTIAHSDMSRVEFWRSDDLIHWTFLSAFASQVGGTWECPDLMRFNVMETGEVMWVLTVAVGGSTGTYFAGQFNGTHFLAADAVAAGYPQDWGLDYYAAISYHNAPGGRNIIVAWMAGVPGYTGALPTFPWRGSYTVPRTLSLHKLQLGGGLAPVYRLHQMPVTELEAYRGRQYSLAAPVHVTSADVDRDLIASRLRFGGASVLDLELCVAWPKAAATFGFLLRTDANHTESVSVGLDCAVGQGAAVTLSVDRRTAGVTGFADSFPSLHTVQMPVAHLQALNARALCMRLLLDRASVEVFVQGGYVALTESVFPSPFVANERLELWLSQGTIDVQSLHVWPLVDPTSAESLSLGDS